MSSLLKNIGTWSSHDLNASMMEANKLYATICAQLGHQLPPDGHLMANDLTVGGSQIEFRGWEFIVTLAEDPRIFGSLREKKMKILVSLPLME